MRRLLKYCKKHQAAADDNRMKLPLQPIRRRIQDDDFETFCPICETKELNLKIERQGIAGEPDASAFYPI